MKPIVSQSDGNTASAPGLSFDLDQKCGILPQVMKLLPMAELNSFPSLVSSISVDEAISRSTIMESCRDDRLLALFALKNFDIDTKNPQSADFWPVGVAVEIIEVRDQENQYLKVSVRGLKRIVIGECIPGEIPQVTILPYPEEVWDEEQMGPLVLEARRLYANVLSLIPGKPVDLYKINHLLENEPAVLADLIMASLPLKPFQKTEFLLIENLPDRYQRLLEHLNRELTNREMGRAISQRIEDSLDRQHREKHLREQIKAIQAELGEGDDLNDLQILAEKIRATPMPDETLLAAERELRRLKMTPPHSSEYGVIRQFLEWIIDLPWEKSTPTNPDLQKARAVLERDHYGLDKVKKRIIEFLAVYQQTANQKCPILCLTGPPGVGKTSLGRSIAEALGREFVRLSLGGLKDEAEIRGHRRTYVGARPGRIISGIYKCGANNPVFLLDEVDKMTSNAHGDPAAALLEALDPEQNDTFTDHYIEMAFDLSNVLFILTANVLEHIPAPLKDRLEVVEVSGYTAAEKTAITKNHLWPTELSRHGFGPSELTVPEEVIEEIIDAYTSEAGCRELSRHLRTMIRNRAVERAEGRQYDTIIRPEELQTILGPPRHAREKREQAPQVGVVTGLAWTPAGGDLMFVEAVAMPGSGRLSLTGKLGDVLKESAIAAISYVRSRAQGWNLDEEWFKHHDLHIHLPHGAIPKDGPSAGVGLVTALVSLMSGLPVRADLAMTGEISLRGLVLPVGGLKEKILAAKRAGLSTVLVPEKNLPDLQELPGYLTDSIHILPVRTVEEVIHLALIGGNIELYSGQPLANLARSDCLLTPGGLWEQEKVIGLAAY